MAPEVILGLPLLAMSTRQHASCLPHHAGCAERRKFIRLNEGKLQVCVKRCTLLDEFGKGEDVQWLNFNQFGIAFVSDVHYSINEKISLCLKTDSLKASNIVGVIHNARRHAGAYRYGVQFYFGANAYMRSSEAKALLTDLESLLQ